MGCDIHCFIEEVRDPMKDGRFAYATELAEIKVNRDYLLFSLMAGVRSEGFVKPVVQPRGIINS